MASRDAPPGSGQAAPALPWYLRSRWRLALVLFLIVVVPLGAFTAAVVLSARNKLEEQAASQNISAARLGAQAVEAHFDGLARLVESYARRHDLSAAVVAGEAEICRAHLRDLITCDPLIDRAFIASPDGVELYDCPPDAAVIGRSFAYRDWYIGVSRSQQTYVSEVYLRAAAPQCDIVAITTPIRDDDKRTIGYIVGQVTMKGLTDRLAQIRPGEIGTVTLIDHQGHLAVPGEDPPSNPINLRSNPLVERMLSGEEASFIGNDPRTGDLSLLSFAKARSIGWVVFAAQPADAVRAPAVALQQAILVLFLVCLAGMLAAGFVCMGVVRRQHLALIELQDLKDQLTGMVVHDLRNPLTATIGSIDLVAESAAGLDSVARADLERAAMSARRVLSLTNTLVDVMRMEQGKLDLHRAPLDLAALVRAKVDEYRPLAQANSLRIEQVVPVAPVRASVDADLLARVFDNLITNAIKHTPAGGRIEVRLASEPASDEIAVSISDTGEGIPAEDVPRLFQKFARASGQKLGWSRDAGLGLVFCRMAVELHGGVIRVESAPGRGSTFRVALPLH